MSTDTAIHQIRKEAAYWVDRLTHSDVSEAERETFQSWLMADEMHEREFRAHIMVLNLARDLPEEARNELLAAPRPRPRRELWLAGLAATLLLIAGVAGWIVYQYEPATTPHVTAAGMTRDVRLPDGSMAHLNTRTELRWLGRPNERRVELREGEVLFDVRRDPSKPFTVVLSGSEIRVLGTRFNVRRRENDEVVVTVLEGVVKVAHEPTGENAQPSWARELRANQQIVYSAAGLLRDVHPAMGANAARWREGILEFEDESLTNIVADLGRYTDLQIVVRDPRVAQLRLGGQLNVRDGIEDSLGLLEKLAPVTTHQSGNTFVLDYQQETAEETR